MAKQPANPNRDKRETLADAAADQVAIDRPWRLWASAIVAAAVLVGALIGFVIIPGGQKENAHLTMREAMRRAAGFKAGSPAMPQPVNQGISVPVSQVSWSPEVMRILASGNTRRGAALADQVCSACHGDRGLSQSNIPSLAGQSPYAIYKQLSDYRSGARVHPQMTQVSKSLVVNDLASVAAYFAAASKEYAAIGTRYVVADTEIVRIATEGDSRRRLPACLSCHANGAGGPIESPVIIGQSREYILAQLNAFAAGQRKNDVYGRMREIALKLTPRERHELARYFEGTL